MGGAKRYHLFSGSSRRQSSLNKKQRLRFKRGAPVDFVGATRPPLRCVYGYDQRLDVFGSAACSWPATATQPPCRVLVPPRPGLTAANWSGQWPGLVGMLNLNGSMYKAAYRLRPSGAWISRTISSGAGWAVGSRRAAWNRTRATYGRSTPPPFRKRKPPPAANWRTTTRRKAIMESSTKAHGIV